jgi:proteic killer suppression protein
MEQLRHQAEKRLRILDSATSLGDLAALNSNRLETPKGNRKGQFSIRIYNDQWGIRFEWLEDGTGPPHWKARCLLKPFAIPVCVPVFS